MLGEIPAMKWDEDDVEEEDEEDWQLGNQRNGKFPMLGLMVARIFVLLSCLHHVYIRSLSHCSLDLDKWRIISLERRGNAPETRDIAVSRSSHRSLSLGKVNEARIATKSCPLALKHLEILWNSNSYSNYGVTQYCNSLKMFEDLMRFTSSLAQEALKARAAWMFKNEGPVCPQSREAAERALPVTRCDFLPGTDFHSFTCWSLISDDLWSLLSLSQLAFHGAQARLWRLRPCEIKGYGWEIRSRENLRCCLRFYILDHIYIRISARWVHRSSACSTACFEFISAPRSRVSRSSSKVLSRVSKGLTFLDFSIT